MNGGHWSEQDLVERLYGIGPEDAESGRHLESCGHCAERWNRLLEQRRELGAEVSDAFLAAERRSIYRRMDHEPAGFSKPRWASALAVALLVIVGILFFRPPVPRTAPVDDASDAQLLSDIYTLEQTSEPKAAAPIRGLFERE